MVKLCSFNIAAAVLMVVLANVSTSRAAFGDLTDPLEENAAGRLYLNIPANAAQHRLTGISWFSGDEKLSFAKVQWNGVNGFLKCIRESVNEFGAFETLRRAEKELIGSNAVGRENVQRPLYAFNPEASIKCFVYNFVAGVKLNVFLEGKTYFDKINLLTQIVPEILKGAIYLHKAGIVHKDLHSENVMVSQIPNTQKLTATIIDYDMAVFLNQAESQKINAMKFINPGIPNNLLVVGSGHLDNEEISTTINDLSQSGFMNVNAIAGQGLNVFITKAIESRLKKYGGTMTEPQKSSVTKRLDMLLRVSALLLSSNSDGASTVAAYNLFGSTLLNRRFLA
ncbi:hypothetical protein BDF19DRAFT_484327 [Syncephalis fuscata]|nr:hypothetical protein BDF19DRAFT_484327 [Syncephalis fuscata]